MGELFTMSTKNGYPDKYNTIRDELKNGDIILYRGTSFMAKSIQYFDKAYYNHVGVVWKPGDVTRVLTFDMWNKGLDCLPLSRRMDGYEDFCVLRPKVDENKVKYAVSIMLEEWDGRKIEYDYFLLLRIAMIKKTGLDLSGLGQKDKFICSEFVQYYCDKLGLNTYSMVNLITPEDFRRYVDENFEILYNNASAPDMSFDKKEIWSLRGKNYPLT
jgi:hypothetical protein